MSAHTGQRSSGGWNETGRQTTTKENTCPRLLAPPDKPSPPILTNRPYLPGMTLYGPGLDPLRSQDRHQPRALHDVRGSGTLRNPTIAWLFDPKPFTPAQRQDHVAIARSVARANEFACILIRKEDHSRQCTYTQYGTRVTRTGANGKEYAVTVPADPHITVFMGTDAGRALVAGHIFVVSTTDPGTGQQRMTRADDPATQRRIVLPGREAVAEEFWLVRGAWEAGR